MTSLVTNSSLTHEEASSLMALYDARHSAMVRLDVAWAKAQGRFVGRPVTDADHEELAAAIAAHDSACQALRDSTT